MFATEEYAEQAGVECSICHLDPSGGGELIAEGQGYALSPGLPGPKINDKASKAAPTKILRFVVGYLYKGDLS